MEFSLHKPKMILKSFLLSTLIIIGLNLNGQIPKGTLMVGGEVNIPFNSQKHGITHSSINPMASYFPMENFSVGIVMENEIDKFDDRWTARVGLGPIVRYFLGAKNPKFFGHIAYTGSVVFSNYIDPDEFLSHIQPGLGISYMLIPTVAIEAILTYNHFVSSFGYTEYNSHTALRIGFQIYFPISKKTQT